MGLLLSVVISYAGLNVARECLEHMLSGMVPDTDPQFQDLVIYYSKLLQKSANPTTPSGDWTKECGQGYLCLTQDINGQLKSAAVKYYDGKPDSTAILFSTKISSFGQESHDSTANGDYGADRYIQPKTKTIVTESLESFTIGQRNKSPIPDNDLTTNTVNTADWLSRNSPDGAEDTEDNHITITEPPVTNQYPIDTYSETEERHEDEEKLTYGNVSDHDRFLGNSFERDERNSEESDAREKLTWHYRPRSPVPAPLPEIQLQNEEENDEKAYGEDYLRSLDGIKLRPLQRHDPSGRRRSYKKRNSSSSSSRESRASREEELKMLTSLEEAEFQSMTKDGPAPGFGSTSNLSARSYSRSRSRESTKDQRNESTDAPADVEELRPKLKDLPKLGSFEEERVDTKDNKEVTEEDEEESVDDFWGNSGD